MPKRQHLLIVLGAVVALWGAMTYSWPNNRSEPVVSLDVASSLRPVMKRQVSRLKRTLPGRPVLSSAGSQTVARQVANGKETDIVFLANVRWMKYIERNDRLEPGTTGIVLGNRLVLVGPTSNTSIRSIGDLRGFTGKLALGNVRAVPAGIYARETLQSMDLWSKRSFETVMFPHVRAVLSAVASGNIPAGIVYQTDLRREPDLRRIATFPDRHVPPIRYPIALVKGASDTARRWYRALLDESAHGTYRKYGFEVVDR